MKYRFELADDVEGGRLHVSNAAGTWLVGQTVEGDAEEAVPYVETENPAVAAVLVDTPGLEDKTDYTDAPDAEAAAPNLTGLVPQSVADRHPDAVRNTDEDRIVPDELVAGPVAVDESSPATETVGSSVVPEPDTVADNPDAGVHFPAPAPPDEQDGDH
jgi:hypothetical protein